MQNQKQIQDNFFNSFVFFKSGKIDLCIEDAEILSKEESSIKLCRKYNLHKLQKFIDETMDNENDKKTLKQLLVVFLSENEFPKEDDFFNYCNNLIYLWKFALKSAVFIYKTNKT